MRKYHNKVASAAAVEDQLRYGTFENSKIKGGSCGAQGAKLYKLQLVKLLKDAIVYGNARAVPKR